MMLRPRVVDVLQWPEELNAEQEQIFLRELAKSLEAKRPRIVLDLSVQCQVDQFAIRLLIHSLEEAMKLNGDIRLASVSRQAREALESARAAHLFQMFDSTTEAIRSFQRPSMAVTSGVPTPESERQGSGNAA